MNDVPGPFDRWRRSYRVFAAKHREMASLLPIFLILVLGLPGCFGAQEGEAGSTCGDDAPPEMYQSVRNRTCLITGISGMIGSYIAREVSTCKDPRVPLHPTRALLTHNHTHAHTHTLLICTCR